MANGCGKTNENIYFRCRKEAAKYDERLSSREGASELLGISVSSLSDYELGNTKVVPVDKVDLMAALYKSPQLRAIYAEVVSPMELQHARKFVDDKHIIYNGVIPDTENKYTVARNGGMVNVENLTELTAINGCAARDGVEVEVGIRVNLNLEGVAQSRFGIRISPENYEAITALKNIKVVGIHCHITKSRDLEYWAQKAEQMAHIATIFNARYIDLGGNMYGPMNPELVKQFSRKIPTFSDYADCIYHHYSWVFVRNDADAELLNRMYDCEYDNFEEHIGEWVCIEQTDDDYFYLTSATQGIKYATSLLEKLGYEVKITRKDEQK